MAGTVVGGAVVGATVVAGGGVGGAAGGAGGDAGWRKAWVAWSHTAIWARSTVAPARNRPSMPVRIPSAYAHFKASRRDCGASAQGWSPG